MTDHQRIETRVDEFPKGIQRSSCQICTGRENDLIYQRDNIRLVRCRSCRLVFMDPLPTPETLAAHYGGQDRDSTSEFTPSQITKKMRRSRRRVGNLKRYVKKGKFLDIGCNRGFIVEAAREAGFDAFGVEINPTEIGHARRHYPKNNYFIGRVEDFAKTEKGFDVIYCSEVIEHVTDLNLFVGAMAQVMNSAGVLYLTTPDISHWRRPKNLEKWDSFGPPGHCVYFNPSNLMRLLENHGLRVFRRHFAWKPGIKLFARKTTI